MPAFDGIYLDHNATTPAKPGVVEKMLETLAFPGNASAVHRAGRKARLLIEDSRQTLLRAINAENRDILVFTSGATEANNLVLQGLSTERVIVSAIEHPSVLNARSKKDILPVLSSGTVDLDALENMLSGSMRQTLVSVMLVNNETGVIQPIEDIALLTRKHGCLLHVDAVQAFGRMPVDIQKLKADFLTLSAHKMGGPQGIGCLVIANCNSLSPVLLGGNQEKNMRAGTENLAAICGFAKAAELIDISGFQMLATWRDRIEQRLLSIAPDVRIFGKDVPRVANTSMFSFAGLSSETQLIALDLAGICVSNGSACSSGTVKASHVLKAMGVSESLAQSSLRVSLGWNTTEKDVDLFIAEWQKIYQRVKK